MANLADYVAQVGAEYGIPPDLFVAQLDLESGLNPAAVGRNTDGSWDRGIAQINNRWHPEVTDAQAFDPAFAVPWAAQYLRGLYDRCGTWQGALEAYNSGSCTGAPQYARAVLTRAGRLQDVAVLRPYPSLPAGDSRYLALGAVVLALLAVIVWA